MPMIYFDGKLAAEEMSPFFSNNRIMVLLRPLTNLAGCNLQWKGNNGSIYFAAQQYQLSLGNKINWLNNSSITLLHPFIMRNNRVFAPVTMWQQLFNAPLRYDESTKSVYLTSFTQHPVTSPVNNDPDTNPPAAKPLDIAMASKELPTVAIVVDSTEEIE